MVAIEHRQKPTTTTTTTTNGQEQQQPHHHNEQQQQQQQQEDITQDEKVQQQEEEGEEEDLVTTSATAVKNSNMSSKNAQESAELAKKHKEAAAAAIAKSSAISQRGVDIKIANKSNVDQASKELTKKVLKLDLSGKELDEYSLKSPKSPISARLSHQTSLTSSVEVEDRKTLREALYQGIFHRHRRTIFAVGSFLRMLRSRNSQYNTIRSSSEGEDIDEPR